MGWGLVTADGGSEALQLARDVAGPTLPWPCPSASPARAWRGLLHSRRHRRCRSSRSDGQRGLQGGVSSPGFLLYLRATRARLEIDGPRPRRPARRIDGRYVRGPGRQLGEAGLSSAARRHRGKIRTPGPETLSKCSTPAAAPPTAAAHLAGRRPRIDHQVHNLKQQGTG